MSWSELKPSEEKWAICDLDGTVCDIGHRVVHAIAKDWDRFHAAHVDDPIHSGEYLMLRAWLDADYQIAFFTGRTDDHRRTTETWLAQRSLPFRALYMRARRDFRPSEIVKSEMLVQFQQDHAVDLSQIAFVMEDQNKLVKMWRERGLTCWQPREDIHEKPVNIAIGQLGKTNLQVGTADFPYPCYRGREAQECLGCSSKAACDAL